MKRKKLSNKAKGKLLIAVGIITPIVLIVGVILARFISIVGGFDNFVKIIKQYFSTCFTGDGVLNLLAVAAVMGGFLLLVMFVNHILPMLCFFIGKPISYFDIWRICRKRGYSFRLHRIPFASLGGVGEKSDIEIQTKDKTLHIHLIDIPFPFLRMFLLSNDHEYCMHRSLPGKLRGFAFFVRSGEQEMDPNNYTVYTIPEFPQNQTEFHYLVISPSYANSFYINGKSMSNITGECVVGNVTVCKMKVLKKRLNNELFTPMR